jgi:hypothetical protein
MLLTAYALEEMVFGCGTSSSPSFEAWLHTLSPEDQQSIDAAVRLLEQRGPGLRRPLDSIEGSRHANMKELRAGTIRVLFAFDPRRAAILLIGGDKRERWQESTRS